MNDIMIYTKLLHTLNMHVEIADTYVRTYLYTVRIIIIIDTHM